MDCTSTPSAPTPSSSINNLPTSTPTDSTGTSNGYDEVGTIRTSIQRPAQISLEPSVCTRIDRTNVSSYRPRQRFNFEGLKSEQARLATYYLPDCPWPVSFINTGDCAKAGFFFLRDGDKVQCAFCRGVAGEWEEGDIPVAEHRKHFPRCPFICHLPVGNIPIDSNEDTSTTQVAADSVASPAISRLLDDHLKHYGYDICGPFEMLANGRTTRSNNSTNIFSNSSHVLIRGALPLDTEDVPSTLVIRTGSGPAVKHLVTLASRVKTFDGWSEDKTGQSATKMSEAGFYYIGKHDHVKCYYCDGGLRNWEAGDDPWLEHARWFANCPFVLLNKGQEYIRRAAKSQPVSKCPSESPTSSNSDSGIGFSQSSTSSSGSCALTDVAGTSSGAPSLESQSSTPISSDAEMSDESEDPVPPTTAVPASICPAAPSLKVSESPEPPSESAAKSELLKVHSESPKTTSELDMAEELRKLKEARQCKICMDNEVDVVFLPCGHLVSCVNCATALSNCALCRQPIKAVVRTYLS